MEDSSNDSFDTSALESEVSALTESINAENKKLDQIIAIMKNQQEQAEKEKKAAEKAAAQEKADALAADQAQKEADEQAQKEADEQAEIEAEEAKNEKEAADAQTETYTELLTDIRDQTALTNEILAGFSLFLGVIVGVLCIRIFWDKLTQ